MAVKKVLILKSAGTNCDMETSYAVKLAGGMPEDVYIHTLIKKPSLLDDYDFIVIPGGFSYGDDLGSGVVLSREINFFIKEEMEKFVKSRRPILGICNGFQVLVKSGLLPNKSKKFVQETSLIFNDNGRFVDKWVYLKVNRENNSPFLKNLPDIFPLPIAHAEGRFVVKDGIDIDSNVAFYYSSSNGNITEEFNPNGSYKNIASITDDTGLILGMMPHPERFIYGYQHPDNIYSEPTPGLIIFKNILSD